MKVDTLAVYWGARSESIEACARRCSTYFERLAEQHAQLGFWYEKGLSKKSALIGKAVNELPLEDVIALVAKGANKRDIGGQVMKELGFYLSLWNKQPEDKAMGLGITCGLFSKIPGLKNSVVIALPTDLKSVDLNSDQLKSILVLTAETWEADWGAVFDSSSDVVLSRQDNEPFLDKMLWLRNEYVFDVAGSDLIKECTKKGSLLVKQA